jgi:exodeoxyribonuclease VII small subunit
MSFEKSMERLEEIAARLEDDDLELDAALALFEEGIAALRSASGSLARAESQLKQLREAADGVFRIDDFRA